MTQTNEIVEPSTSTNNKLTVKELIERFAEIQGLSIEEATELVGADTEVEVMRKIQDYTLDKIKHAEIKLNRKQRRAIQRKHGTKNVPLTTTLQEEQDVINDAARRLAYIDLIQKLRKLNEKKAKENENGETIDTTD